MGYIMTICKFLPNYHDLEYAGCLLEIIETYILCVAIFGFVDRFFTCENVHCLMPW